MLPFNAFAIQALQNPTATQLAMLSKRRPEGLDGIEVSLAKASPFRFNYNTLPSLQ